MGNPLSYYNGDRYTFSWTEGRKLASSTYDGRATTYEYDHEGLRTKKEKSDGCYILYDIVDGRTVGETYYSASHAVQYYLRYIFDENAGVIGISLWYPGDTVWTDYYFVKNLQGDVLQVYKASDHSLVTSYTYDSWGNILSVTGSKADTLGKYNPLRYRGYVYDHETGLYYLQSRYYDPEIGRFINADGYASTGQGILGNNMFSYCGNNPVNMMDPTGYLAISNTRQFFVVMALGVTLATVVRPNADKVVDGFRDIIDVISERIVELFDTPLTLTPDELTGIAKGYEVGECLQAAEAMQKKNGNRGHIIHLYFPNAHNGYVCSERYG